MRGEHHEDTVAPLNPSGMLELGRLARQRAGSISLAQVPPLRPLPLGPVTSRRNSIMSSGPSSPRLRRKSISVSRRASLAAWPHLSRVSFSGMPLLQPLPEIRLENTYHLGPEEDCRFEATRVCRILRATLEGCLADARYAAPTCGQLCQSIADLVHARAREAAPPRYKLVCQVVLGQCGQQGLQVSSQCLWDSANDSYTSAAFRNASIYAVATVHAVYFE